MPLGISNLLPDVAKRVEAIQTVAEVIDYSAQIEMVLLAVGILIGVILGGILFRRWL